MAAELLHRCRRLARPHGGARLCAGLSFSLIPACPTCAIEGFGLRVLELWGVELWVSGFGLKKTEVENALTLR